METAFLIGAQTVQTVLEAVSLAMVARMLLPIFVDAEGNRLYALTALITEPFVAPFRALLAKFNIGQSSPIDWGFFVAYFAIWLLCNFLPAI